MNLRHKTILTSALIGMALTNPVVAQTEQPAQEQTAPANIMDVIKTPAARRALRTLKNEQHKAATALQHESVKQAIKLRSEWESEHGDITLDETGALVFVYSDSEHTLVCAPLRVCVITFEQGEKIIDYTPPDSTRWQYQPSFSGSGSSITSHLEIKPQRGGLTTGLTIKTDRRLYLFKLISDENIHIPHVKFVYKNTAMPSLSMASRSPGNLPGLSNGGPDYATAFDAYKGSPKIEHSRYSLKTEKLNFGYDISGDKSIKPLRVYDDGVKTYIEFDPKIRDLPVLLVKDTGKQEIVNYSNPTGNKYVVTSLFDKAELVAGVGWRKKKVKIHRMGGDRNQFDENKSANRDHNN